MHSTHAISAIIPRTSADSERRAGSDRIQVAVYTAQKRHYNAF